MGKRVRIFVGFSWLTLLFLSTFYLPNAFAQVVKSNCVQTQVGVAAPAVLPPECLQGAGGVGIAPDGFVFPLKTTKAVIEAGSSHGGVTYKWCKANQSNCHHHYNAADIFAATGTTVIAAVPGMITAAKDSGSVGHTVSMVSGDNVYYYAHMGSGTLKVSMGQNVKAGDELGQVGTAADAVGTPPHLHFDILPSSAAPNGRRVSCSGGGCIGKPFINVQPLLIPAYEMLTQ